MVIADLDAVILGARNGEIAMIGDNAFSYHDCRCVPMISEGQC
jgi:hypothetical protein